MNRRGFFSVALGALAAPFVKKPKAKALRSTLEPLNLKQVAFFGGFGNSKLTPEMLYGGVVAPSMCMSSRLDGPTISDLKKYVDELSGMDVNCISFDEEI